MATYSQIVNKTTASNLVTIGGRTYSKNSSGFALCGYYYITSGFTGPIVVSPTQSLASFSWSGGTIGSAGSIVVNGTRWYYSSSGAFMSGNQTAQSGSYTQKIGSFSSASACAQSLVETYYTFVSKVEVAVSPSGAGTTSIVATYEPIPDYMYKTNTFRLTAYANPTYRFSHWSWSTGSGTSSNNPETFGATQNITVTANFIKIYAINIDYPKTLGYAWYQWYSNYINLSARPKSNAYFIGWYINSTLISTSLNTSYTPTGDVTIEARFGVLYQVDSSVVGNGSIQVSRNINNVSISVIPNANHHFVKYVLFGVDNVRDILVDHQDNYIVTHSGDTFEVITTGESETTTTPLNLTLVRDISVVAYIEEDEKYHIYASANIPNASVYVSHNDDYSGYEATVWARPFPDYTFVRWQDGSLENPRQLTVTEDITVFAIYHRITDTNGIYQYRCYIKDQLDMTAPPKAFMIVDTFDINTDLMTNSNSTINVLKNTSNVNNGDVLVLYDPMGTTLYTGVIKSIDNRKIICSQMQSFYKGLWIYNVHPSATLEQEIAWLLGQYAQGKIYRSSYTDPLVAQRLGGITIDYIGTTSANLPTDLDKDGNEQLTQKDMESWIYELYENYGIVFDFEINMSGTNYVHIKVPSYATVKVGNNMFAIQNMSPITTIEETNRLIIFSKNKVYRTTYVAKKNGIVENPASTVDRFDLTNTKVVFSDDEVSDLVASNLPSTMYNHKLSFTLIIKNFIYQFGDFNLGGSLDVWYNDDYFNTVLTGYHITKESNKNITKCDFTCGKVRVALTKLLTLGKV